MKTAFRYLLIVLAVLVVLIVGALAALFGAAQTQAGKDRIVALAEGAAAGPDVAIDLGRLTGTVPFDMRLDRLAVADGQGSWLSAEGVRVAWRPAALLRGRLAIEAVTADRIALDRTPAAPAEPAPEPEREAPAGPPGLPDLPVGITLDRLAVGEVVLAEPVVGEAMRLGVAGSARLVDPASGLHLDLSVDRLDGATGTASLQAAYRPGDERLSVTLAVEEQPGGLIARAAGLPGLPPVILSLTGDGPLDAWEATLIGRAGDLGVVEADLGLAALPDAEGARRVTLDGFLEAGSAMPAPAARLAAGRSTAEAAAVIGADGAIAIERLRIAAAAGQVTAGGRVDPGAGTLALDWRVEAGEPTVFADFLPPDIAWSGLAVDGRAEGALTAPRVTATVAGEGLAAAGATLDGVTLDLTAAPLGDSGTGGLPERFALGLEGRIAGAAGFDGALEAALAPETRLSAEGEVGLDGAIDLASATLDAPGWRLAAEAALTGFGAEGTARVDLAVPELSELAPLTGPARGAADLTARIERAGGATTVALDGTGRGLATGIAQADGLLGDRVTLDADITAEPDGTVEVARVRVDGAAIAASADGIVLPDALALGFTVTLPDLAAALPEAEGALTLTGDVSGPLADPTVGIAARSESLTIAGQAIEGLALDAVVGALTGGPRGQASVSAAWRGLPASAETRFTVGEAGGVALAGLSASLASFTLAGDLAVDGTGGLDGRLEGGTPRLADLAPVAGVPLSGSVRLAIEASTGDESGQGVEVTLDADSLSAADARVARLRLTAAVTDALAAPAIEARLTAGEVAAGGLAFTTAAITARGGLDGLSVTAEADGEPLEASAALSLAAAEGGLTVAIDRLTGAFQTNPFRLERPATIALAPRAVTVDGLRLAGVEGRLAVDGRVGDTHDMTVTLTDLPLELLRLASPALAFTGSANGEVRLTGPRDAPDARLTVTAERIGTDAAEAAGLPGFALDVAARLTGGTATAEVSVIGERGGRVRAEARLPAPVDPASGLPRVGPETAVTASVDGSIDLVLVNELLAAGADRVEGGVEIALRLSGTIGDPDAAGRITLADAAYRNEAYGVRITGINAALIGTPDALVLESFSAVAGGQGSIEADGALRLDAAEGLPGRFTLTARNARLIDSDIATADVDADLLLEGRLGTRPALSGTVTTRRVEARIPDRLPGGATPVTAFEVNPPPALAERVQAERERVEGPPSAFDLDLDLVVEVPGQVFLRGRGLDAELQGRLTITGTANDPLIDGELSLRRGTLDLLGNRLDFERGTVTFVPGGDVDPLLDFRATSDIGDGGRGIVAVGGRASSPSLAFSAEPELPEDEVLSRILFGKSTGQLSTVEAVQLAESAAQLTGVGPGGPGLVDRVRRAVGVDRLDVETGEGGTGATISAGRYVSENVFVGVRQGTEAESSGVTVEVEVTPNVTVRSDVGSTGQTTVGIGMEWDY
ncbi:MAG: translocation/assembly module TamB domain-containing protein [Azospirillaceae bacterium]